MEWMCDVCRDAVRGLHLEAPPRRIAVEDLRGPHQCELCGYTSPENLFHPFPDGTAEWIQHLWEIARFAGQPVLLFEVSQLKKEVLCSTAKEVYDVLHSLEGIEGDRLREVFGAVGQSFLHNPRAQVLLAPSPPRPGIAADPVGQTRDLPDRLVSLARDVATLVQSSEVGPEAKVKLLALFNDIWNIHQDLES